MNNTIRFLCLITALTCQSCYSATVANKVIQLKKKDTKALSLFLPSNGVNTHWIDVSEQTGLSIVNDNESLIAEVSVGAVSSVVYRQNLRIATYDNNTQDIQYWQASNDSILEIDEHRLNIGGVETLCSGEVDGKLQTFVIDDLGELHQYALREGVQPILVRQFAIGPGIKSCAVDTTNNQLWLADETAGVWNMSASAEAEITRELSFYSADYVVEGVATALSSNIGPVTAWVSPDVSGIWVNTLCSRAFVEFNIQISPEVLTLGTTPTGISISVYDDESGEIFQGAYPLTCDNNSAELANPISLLPTSETTPVEHTGDAADDPAIWVNSNAPNQSLVLGTDKKGGLAVYDLTGQQTAWHPVGRVNNVDVKYNIAVDGVMFDVAVASNRTSQSMSVFLISTQNGELTHVSDIETGLKDVYGFCLYNNAGTLHGLVNDTSGDYEQYQLSINRESASGTLIRSFSLPSQPEGCVVDDIAGVAYMGEESAGIWQLDLTSPAAPEKIISVSAPVEADVEGLGLYEVDGVQYLIASSQGNNQYAIYQSKYPFKHIGMIEVASDWETLIDGVSETDGLDITNANLGGRYTDGLFVVQDGRNVMPTENQNFKYIDGTQVKQAIRVMLELR